MKIQFGCGSNRLEGWKNHDSDADFTKRLPYADSVADFILIEHALEHTDAPGAYRFMEEANRILKPGGVLRICVPHLDNIFEQEHRRDLILGHGHQMVYTERNLVLMLQTAGFSSIHTTNRKECDGHWRVIGIEKDDIETLRVEAVK